MLMEQYGARCFGHLNLSKWIARKGSRIQEQTGTYASREHWLIHDCYVYVIVHSSTKLWYVKYKLFNSCLWKLRSKFAKNYNTWVIRKVVGPHNCYNVTLNEDHE